MELIEAYTHLHSLAFNLLDARLAWKIGKSRGFQELTHAPHHPFEKKNPLVLFLLANVLNAASPHSHTISLRFPKDNLQGTSGRPNLPGSPLPFPLHDACPYICLQLLGGGQWSISNHLLILRTLHALCKETWPPYVNKHGVSGYASGLPCSFTYRSHVNTAHFHEGIADTEKWKQPPVRLVSYFGLNCVDISFPSSSSPRTPCRETGRAWI